MGLVSQMYLLESKVGGIEVPVGFPLPSSQSLVSSPGGPPPTGPRGGRGNSGLFDSPVGSLQTSRNFPVAPFSGPFTAPLVAPCPRVAVLLLGGRLPRFPFISSARFRRRSGRGTTPFSRFFARFPLASRVESPLCGRSCGRRSGVGGLFPPPPFQGVHGRPLRGAPGRRRRCRRGEANPTNGFLRDFG